MSFVTTEPAPMTTSSHTETGRSVALLPMETFFPISVLLQRDFTPRAGPPVAKRSLMNITPCPIKQSSPIITSSQINVCDCTLVRLPIVTLRCISTNGPMNTLSPIEQPYKLTGLIMVTLSPNITSTIPASRKFGVLKMIPQVCNV